MFVIQYWTAQDGWKDWHIAPRSFSDAESMIKELRVTRPAFPWRALQILDL